MSAAGGGFAADSSPDAKRKRVELNPDIAETISAVESVKELARRNNAETRPRKRMRPAEFLNDAFYVISLAAVKDHSRAVDTIALFEEFITQHHLLPRSSTLSKVFYAWMDGGLAARGLDLLQRLLTSSTRVSAAVFADALDEKVATVALRLVTSPPRDAADALSATEREALVHHIISLVPQESLRRRVFSPVLAFAREQGDWGFAHRLLHMAVGRRIELWDADYNELLRTIDSAKDAAAATARLARLESILEIMSEQHPVVGARNAELVHRIAGGNLGCGVSEAGECSHCRQQLHSFDLCIADRAVLLADIEAKLVLPRAQGLSRYEPEKKVTEEEVAKRLAEFSEFKSRLVDLPYDTVIDGANVGYYGLNSWYSTAKREELLAAHKECAGRDAELPPQVLDRIPSQPPFPVDVSPKFTLIETMRAAAVRKGKRPLIILHSRHLSRGTAENTQVLERWRQERAVLASPAFLNDDYCWLYAAITRPDTFVISNDQMRDHHFCMLSPRFFVRWRQRHRITYKAFYSETTRTVSLNIRLPRCYSVWVQRAALAAAAGAAAGGHYWHIPYVESIPVIDQATNRTVTTLADVDLNKDGDDNCSAWLCTFTPRLSP